MIILKVLKVNDNRESFNKTKRQVLKLLKQKDKETEDEIKRVKKCQGQKGGAVIGHGGFGCVFRPALKCKTGKESKKKDYISKLLVDRPWRIKREVNMGKIIKSIDKFEHFFSPVLKVCSVNIEKIKQSGMHKCKKIVKRSSQKDKYNQAIVKLKYVEGGDIIDNFNQNTTFNGLCLFFSMYQKLLYSLSLLQKKNIVHYDIKADNILIDKKTKNPIIIDFGLSIDISYIENLEKAFYIEWAPEWTLWPIEVHYLGFVISKKRKMKENELLELSSEYNEKHSVFHKDTKKQINDYDIQTYKNETTKMLRTYNSMELSQSIEFIIKQYWKTWDNYSLSIMYLRQFFVLNLDGFSKNHFNSEFINLLFLNIHPNPNLRLSLKYTETSFKKILSNLSHTHIYLISNNMN